MSIVRSTRALSLLVALLLANACGAGQKPAPSTERHDHPSNAAMASDRGPDATVTTSRCVEPTLAPAASSREKGIDAFLADRPTEAVKLLSEAVRSDPRDRAADAFLSASLEKLSESQERATRDVASLRFVRLDPIPLAYVHHRSVEGIPSAKVRLEKVSETKNLITDFADWEANNQLPRVRHRGRNSLSAGVPTLHHEPLRQSFVHADHVAAIYATSIVVTSEGKQPRAFDARAAMQGAPRTLEVTFAQLVADALVVELAYNGYAKESGGKNGYFAAYDASSGHLLWATDPLVANTAEAVVTGGSIVTGYGFTAEPDFLFVLDLATGKVDQKIPVKSGPEAIRVKGDRVYVRSYDTDYVFKAATGLAPAPPASLMSKGKGTAALPDGETRCWVRRATASIASRDTEGLREAAARLSALSRDRFLGELLQSEVNKLSTEGLDLSAAPIVVVPAPPWQATPPLAGGSKPAPKLVKLSSSAASPTRNTSPAFDPSKPYFIAPIDQGKLPEGAPAGIPRSYGQETLRALIPDQRPSSDRRILLYGGRYLALLEGETAERVFDLESFRHPPKATPQWKEFAVQDVTYAQERDGVLYVCSGGGSYAKEVYGKKGFLSALDATTGKLLWRSAPLTCNATFAVADDHLVSGYGFTAEPDYVFIVRRSDGATVQRVAVDSAPETITLTGSRVHVEAYGAVVELELR